MTDTDKPSPAIAPEKFFPVDHLREAWGIEVGEEVTPNDVCSPVFWRHVAGRLKVRDRIEVFHPHWDLSLRVVVAGDGLVMTRVISSNAPDAPKAVADTAADAEPKKIAFVPGKGYRVRGSTKFFKTKQEAEASA